jgi:hypothetical protein
MNEFFIYFGIIAAFAVGGYLVYSRFIKKDDYEVTKSEAFIDLPEKLPVRSYSAMRANVYVQKDFITREQYDLIDRVIQRQIDILNNPVPQFTPNDVTKKWTRFKKHSDYHILILPPTYRSQSEEYAGAPLLTMKSGQTVAGTVVGFKNKSGVIKGTRPFAVVPHPEDNQNWMQLWEEGLFNELQHLALIQETGESSQIFLAYSGQGDIHPLYGHRISGFKAVKRANAPCGMK